jgi:hypothetical protein
VIELTDQELVRSIRVCIQAWIKARPHEFEATKRYVEKLRDNLVNPRVPGLTKEAMFLEWGFYPGSLFDLFSLYLPKGWDIDKRFMNLFFGEFKLGCVNQTTKANADRCPHPMEPSP